MSGEQHNMIEWRDGHLPVSLRFDDPYFSLDNGLEETRHVFLAGNGLPGRFCDGFHIGELGFGTGLNLLAVVQLWRESGQRGTLHFTTFEAFPLSPDEMSEAHRAFPALDDLSRELAPLWQAGPGRFTLPGLVFELIPGDARATLPPWGGQADAWFLDGFSPARNPELWTPELMQTVADHTTPGGTAATYTAAGHVRRSLAEAGFDVTRHPGYGRKRHMTACTLPR
ncbi:tRNA (5-methylaminomethyl-2-thiouridine)(34)-methyltransferase MnmD [Oceaniglobus trochenteri]|uniref:tRNA (5-methylaminomethyl-2-thiouridine)(34)-methyltransferase MnmD n=1 Tax=Oceaniglobus trochenteri TaxID=2763260 RepID=UPI001CFF8213|nr:tRNA (5-methylaminomethyl-2-thiouridine)(34)-methyltransferase MnmD [Oceaniglobus trochenteri]